MADDLFFIKRLTIPNHVQMLPVILGFQVESVTVKSETVDGVLSAFVLFSL